MLKEKKGQHPPHFILKAKCLVYQKLAMLCIVTDLIINLDLIRENLKIVQLQDMQRDKLKFLGIKQ